MKTSFTTFIFLLTISILISINNLHADNIKIIEQPKSITECQGKAVTLSIDAQSDENLKLYYQWYKDNKIIPGGITFQLKFESLNYEQSGTYFCRIKSEGSEESVDSHPAALYVLIPTSITKEPEDIRFNDVFLDSNIILSFDAHINGMTIEEAISVHEYVKIDWFTIVDKSIKILSDDETYSGTKSNNLSIKLSNVKDTSYYFAVVEGKCGSDTTRIVCVIKNFNDIMLTIKTQDLTICENENISLTSETNTNLKNMKIEYRWYKDGKSLNYKGNLKGVFSEELIFNPIKLQDAGKYQIEAKIKEMNYRVFSKEVNVKVNEKPEILCITVDTSSFVFTSPYLSVFFKYNSDSIYIDIYKDGVIYETYSPLLWGYELIRNGIINKAFLITDKYDIDAKYWAIERTKANCGINSSDTVTIRKDLNNLIKCDPWQLHQNYCINQSCEFQFDFELKSKDKVKNQWIRVKNGTSIDLDDNQFIQGSHTNRLILTKLKKEDTGLYFLVTTPLIDSLTLYFSPDFILNVKSPPIITTKPISRKVVIDSKQTIFSLNYEYVPEDSNIINLYYMSSLSDKSKLIKTFGTMGGWNFKYEKNVTLSDDGYYFATISNGNCDSTISDTVRVNVLPSGSITDVINNSNNDLNFSVYPNPAKDYIEIQPSEGFKPSEGSDIQIFDMLGVNVFNYKGNPTPTLPEGEGVRIDVSFLAPGVYFIKIVNRVGKFVKM